MVKVLTLLALVISLNASAQRAPEPTDIPYAGELLEKSAKQRSHALIVMIGCSVASGVMFAIGDDTGRVVGPIVLGAGTLVSLGISIGSINNQARAGRILQGK